MAGAEMEPTGSCAKCGASMTEGSEYCGDCIAPLAIAAYRAVAESDLRGFLLDTETLDIQDSVGARSYWIARATLDTVGVRHHFSEMP